MKVVVYCNIVYAVYCIGLGLERETMYSVDDGLPEKGGIYAAAREKSKLY